VSNYGCMLHRESGPAENHPAAEGRRSAALAVSYGDWRVEVPLLVRLRGTMTGGPDLQLQLLDVRWGTSARECGTGTEAGPEERRTVQEGAAEVGDRVAALAFASMLFPDRVSPVTAPGAVLGMLAAAVGLSAGVLAMAATDVHLERKPVPRSRSARQRQRAQDEEALQLMLQGAFICTCACDCAMLGNHSPPLIRRFPTAGCVRSRCEACLTIHLHIARSPLWIVAQVSG